MRDELGEGNEGSGRGGEGRGVRGEWNGRGGGRDGRAEVDIDTPQIGCPKE